MSNFVRRASRHLTYANVMATFAAFVALGGVSYAAVAIPRNAIGTAQLKNNAVSSAKVKSRAITGSKLANRAVTGAKLADRAVTGSKLQEGAVNSRSVLDGSLTASDFAPGTMLAGPQGERGERGLAGSPGLKGDKGDTGATGAAGADGLARGYAAIHELGGGNPGITNEAPNAGIVSVTASPGGDVGVPIPGDGIYCIDTTFNDPKGVIVNAQVNPLSDPMRTASATIDSNTLTTMIDAGFCTAGTDIAVFISGFADFANGASLEGQWNGFTIAII